ncbi:DUF4301 family protein [Rapidithrix thailandica]|uniref:DUF4301 family protein n=1 Tax=Rapidithrix thailandica TaxID=413964 RepID=A0AAW9SFX6_9BACT
MEFLDQDLKQFESRGISLTTVEAQIKCFQKGFPYMKVTRPATLGDGILNLDEDQLDDYIAAYEQALTHKSVLKFVPASGAASRMFKALFECMESYQNTEEDYAKLKGNQGPQSLYTFFKQLEDFAFFEDLKTVFRQNEGMELEEALLKRKYVSILTSLLTEKGLNYGALPKGLLKFHSYSSESRTPVEEHLVEGANYAKGKNAQVQLHFTVSLEHEEGFQALLDEVRQQYETAFDVKYRISFSHQKPSTDTLAVDLQNQPFRLADNSIFFRPGGHGALIENLAEVNADYVFIKNIDNVVPDRLKEITYKYKKALGGVLVSYQERIFAYLNKLEQMENGENEGLLAEILTFLEDELNIRRPAGESLQTGLEQLEYCKAKLNRPIRVCGMVKNEGEPGGGPFWAINADQTESLQIVESAQLDMDQTAVQHIVKKATHFNPVDLVCAIKDYQGKSFDLGQYIDPQTGFISHKSKDGRALKALELPGLWNGAMSDWITLFVEVPIITFNPVKTVNDLLRETHQ